VSKTWDYVEQNYPPQPAVLSVVGMQCHDPSYVSFHLRDTRNLTRLHLSPLHSVTLQLQSHLFNHLTLLAPALDCLDFRQRPPNGSQVLWASIRGICPCLGG